MSQQCPSSMVPPELLERDSLPALLDLLRTAGPDEVLVDLTGCPRLPTPVVQILLAAARDGIHLRLQGASPSLAAALRALGLSAALPLVGVEA